jgi:hypothetical protein
MKHAGYQWGAAVALAGMGIAFNGGCAMSERLGAGPLGEGGNAGDDSGAIAGLSGSGGSPLGAYTSCDARTALAKSCGFVGCHAGSRPIGDLNLLPDDGLVARLKDVPASLQDLDCDPTDIFVECTSTPPECVPYVGALLVDSANPDASFILTKLGGRSGCGNQMPLAPGNMASQGWNDERRACIEELVRAIAALP